ncbi:hypothetical protein Tco_0904809, partial [Tanacetum coccineum]
IGSAEDERQIKEMNEESKDLKKKRVVNETLREEDTTKYSEITLEGIELILWGDLKIMMESSTVESDQELKDRTIIHMLVERRYPLSKELLQRMLDLGLEVGEESTAKVKRYDKDFIDIGFAEDERQIKEMNEESKDPKKKRVVNETPREEDTAKVPAEQEVIEQGTKKRKSGHVKMIARKRPRPQPDDDSDD